MPANLEQFKVGGDNAGNTGTASLNAATADGNVLLLAIFAYSGPGATGFTQDATVNGGGFSMKMSLFRKDSVAGESSWPIVYGGNGGSWCAMEWSGLMTGTAPDKTATNTGGATGTSTPSGTTAATTQADELAIACFAGLIIGSAGPSFSGYTNSFVELSDFAAGSPYGQGLAVATKNLTATGTQSCTATCSASTYHEGLIATYKCAAVAPAEESGRRLLLACS